MCLCVYVFVCTTFNCPTSDTPRRCQWYARQRLVADVCHVLSMMSRCQRGAMHGKDMHIDLTMASGAGCIAGGMGVVYLLLFEPKKGSHANGD